MNTIATHLETAARHYDREAEESLHQHTQAHYRTLSRDVRQILQNNERLTRDLRAIINSSSDLDQHQRGTLCEAIRALGGNP